MVPLGNATSLPNCVYYHLQRIDNHRAEWGNCLPVLRNICRNYQSYWVLLAQPILHHTSDVSQRLELWNHQKQGQWCQRNSCDNPVRRCLANQGHCSGYVWSWVLSSLHPRSEWVSYASMCRTIPLRNHWRRIDFAQKQSHWGRQLSARLSLGSCNQGWLRNCRSQNLLPCLLNWNRCRNAPETTSFSCYRC